MDTAIPHIRDDFSKIEILDNDWLESSDITATPVYEGCNAVTAEDGRRVTLDADGVCRYYDADGAMLHEDRDPEVVEAVEAAVKRRNE